MQFLHHRFQCRPVCFLALADRTDHDIFRCVFHVDEFENLRPVAGHFEELPTDSVGQKRRHTFFQKAVL